MLARCRRQTFIRHEILAVHRKLGSRASPRVIGHHDDVCQAFAIAAIHLLHEAAKCHLPGFTMALIDVVGHVVGQQI